MKVYYEIMPAKNALKTYVENSYYHLYNRGVNKGIIFVDEEDYKTFLFYLKIYLSPINLQGESLKVAPSHTLKNYSERVKLHAYCLMPNHFHLLVFQKNPEDINFFMRSLASKYSMYFNHKHKRVGPLFQGVYKGVLIDSEEQLLYLTKYIHRNPLGILPSGRVLEGYKYSSYGNYLNLFNQDWVNKEDILGLFSKTEGAESYKTFVEETDERDLPTIKSVLIEEI